MKLKKVLFIVLFMAEVFSGLAQNSSYAVIYIHRLKKSTNAGVTYTVFYNDVSKGTMTGVDLSITQDSKGCWLIAKQEQPGKFYVKIFKGSQEIDKIVVNAVAGKSYFVEFNPAAGYDVKPLKLLSYKEGHDQLASADKKEFKIIDSDLNSVVETERNLILDDIAEDNNTNTNSNQTTNNTVVQNNKTNNTKVVENQTTATENTNITKSIVKADVDINIPAAVTSNSNRYALIIGNEDYAKYQNDLNTEANVEFAENDARMFKEYVVKTLGTPEKNVTLLINATTSQMKQGLTKINLLEKNSAGKADIIFYYAGHGLPDETTKEPYMIPVDVNGAALDDAIKLKDAYAKLTEFPAQKVTVFLDACFSGGGRNQSLNSTRAIKINPKVIEMPAKIIVFAGTSGEQSASPYKEKQHGLFTYFLLKKLQETKGNLTYKDLGNFLVEKVALESVLINNKEQNPQIIVSPDLKNTWETWKFK
jgi:hypothetical protein